MLAFSNDYYGMIFRATQSVELFCAYIQKASRGCYHLPKTANDSVNQVLSISITSMKALESQIKEFNRLIATQMELLPNVLISIPGIGPVFSGLN